LREEARKLFDKYARDVTFIHHVIHTPTVRALLDDIYDKLAQDQPVAPGQVALLMSIFGSSSYAWTLHDMDPAMFIKLDDAHYQSTMWVRSCLDLLDHCRRCSIRSFEALQATVITFFMLVNLEGMTMRYASMVGQAISMAREIGLHRLDHPNFATSEQAPKPGTIAEEIGRRIWWYLCATDWYICPPLFCRLFCTMPLCIVI
jgi:Fungal specific transcription factor domain